MVILSWRMGGLIGALLLVVVPAAAESFLKDPLHSESSPFPFRPTHIAAGSTGGIYVADDVTQLIQVFNYQGYRQTTFDFNYQDSYWPTIAEMAVDSLGNLHVAHDFNSRESRITTFSPMGEILSEQAVARGITDFAMGPGDQRFVLVNRIISVLDAQGQLVRSDYTGNVNDIEFGPDGKLYAERSSEMVVFDQQSLLMEEPTHRFSMDQPTFGSNEGFTISNDAIYRADDRSGTIRRYTLTGEPRGTGYAVPRTSDLVVLPDGKLLASTLDTRIVDHIGEERFQENYAGVTRYADHANNFSESMLQEGGVDLSDGWQETLAPTFIVPGVPGEMVDLTFHVAGKRRGGTNLVIGAFPVKEITADPIRNPMGYRRQALQVGGLFSMDQISPCAANPNFCPVGAEPTTAITTMSFEAGTEIGFLSYTASPWLSRSPFLLEYSKARADSLLADLEELSDEELAEELTRNFDAYLRASLPGFVSDSRANWGRMDQFITFLSEDSTLIGIEDLHLAGSSDAEFTDFVFRIDVRLIPVPEPLSLQLLIPGLCLLARRGKR